MATIYDTTMAPSKLELLAPWLPTRPWYSGHDAPRLRKAGGFRLDDPAGEVGIEFLFVAEEDAGGSVYHVPLTYRGTPLPSAERALIGTAEHGVLGTRWIYDGTRDPVLVAQSLALCQGEAAPQHQSRSDAADPSVQVSRLPATSLLLVEFTTSDGDLDTRMTVLARGRDASEAVQVEIGIARVLADSPDQTVTGDTTVLADWKAAGGSTRRGVVMHARLAGVGRR